MKTKLIVVATNVGRKLKLMKLSSGSVRVVVLVDSPMFENNSIDY